MRFAGDQQPLAAAAVAASSTLKRSLMPYGIRVEQKGQKNVTNATLLLLSAIGSDASDSREINTLLCGIEFGALSPFATVTILCCENRTGKFYHSADCGDTVRSVRTRPAKYISSTASQTTNPRQVL